jgi:hypothetical protein
MTDLVYSARPATGLVEVSFGPKATNLPRSIGQDRAMSALGQERPVWGVRAMSASPPKASELLRHGKRRLGLTCRLESGSFPHRIAAERDGARLRASIGGLT